MSSQRQVYRLIQAGLIIWQFGREGENSALDADGVWGEHSRSVAQMFQRFRGLPVTGEPSADMMMMLFPTRLIPRSLINEVFSASVEALLDGISQQEMPFLSAEVTQSQLRIPFDTDQEEGSHVVADEHATADIDVELVPTADDDKDR